jgi:hypothetical protein
MVIFFLLLMELLMVLLTGFKIMLAPASTVTLLSAQTTLHLPNQAVSVPQVPQALPVPQVLQGQQVRSQVQQVLQDQQGQRVQQGLQVQPELQEQ